MWIAVLITTIVASASASPPSLTPEERSRIRYGLESLWNEVDLLIRNRRVDRADLERQEREMQNLKTYERIPFQERIEDLRSQLSQGAREHELRILRFRVTRRSRPARPLPSHLYTDQARFRLAPEQVAQEIDFKIEAEGRLSDARDWARSWTGNQMRLVELERISEEDGHVVIEARAFRFREFRFPYLRFRDPLSMIPSWARRDTDEFARKEPVLWSFVSRIRAFAPEAEPLCQIRGRFAVNDARMSFFLSKAAPKNL